MLVIRNAQLRALRDSILRDVEDEALAAWQEADRPAAEDVRLAIARALTYGLASREQLLRFLDVGRKLSLDFDVDPNRKWASEILNDAEITAALKISILEERAR
jgi:hypothetical protein